MTPNVLILGELNVDLVLQCPDAVPVPGKEVLAEDFRMTLGSASAICAAGLARLGNGVRFVGRIGRDFWGQYCVDTLSRAGVDTSGVRSETTLKTGVTVSISSPQDRALVTYLGSITALDGADVDDEALGGIDHLHVSSYFLQRGLQPHCRTLFARATELGLTTSLDCGFDPAERWNAGLIATLEQVDLFFPNEEELRAVSGCSEPAAAIRALDNGRTRVIAKLGGRGCLAIDGTRVVHVPALPVDVVDTTGAGDSFNAGFLHRWLRGGSLEECLRYGAACGALSTRAIGGTAAQPTPDEVDRLLQART